MKLFLILLLISVQVHAVSVTLRWEDGGVKSYITLNQPAGEHTVSIGGCVDTVQQDSTTITICNRATDFTYTLPEVIDSAEDLDVSITITDE